MKKFLCPSACLSLALAAFAIFSASQSLAQPYENKAYDRGMMHFSSKEYNKAISAFDEAIGLDDTNKLAYMMRGKTFFELATYDMAVKDFTHVIDFDPQNAEAYFWRAKAHAKAGEHDLARADFKTARKLDPNLAHKEE